MTTALVLADPEVVALAFVNECRAELGYRPLSRLPIGTRASVHDCPIATALRPTPDDSPDWPPRRSQGMVNDGGFKLSGGYMLGRASVERRDLHIWSLPEKVSRFIKDFDQGKYPRLDRAKVTL